MTRKARLDTPSPFVGLFTQLTLNLRISVIIAYNITLVVVYGLRQLAEITEREREIIEQVRSGASSPSQLASKLGISQSGASQALQKLATKGQLTKRRGGRSVQYQIADKAISEDRYFLFQAYNALSQVWAYIMSTKLSRIELAKARQARETLEKLLAKRK